MTDDTDDERTTAPTDDDVDNGPDYVTSCIRCHGEISDDVDGAYCSEECKRQNERPPTSEEIKRKMAPSYREQIRRAEVEEAIEAQIEEDGEARIELDGDDDSEGSA